MDSIRQKRSIREKTTSKASLFLMEMMIGIVFFAIAATGCVQVFARAHLLSQEAEDLQMAQSLAAETVEELRADAELWRNLVEPGETDNAAINDTAQRGQEEIDTEGIAEGQTVQTQDYDENWELCGEAAEAEYHLTATVSIEQETAEQTATNDTQNDEENQRNVRLGHIRVSVAGQDGTELYALETDQAIPYTLADVETEP